MSEPFWLSGLHFECARCSSCCRHDPGVVLLSRTDVRNLMAFLGLDFKAFFSKYCRLVNRGEEYAISLLEASNYDCVFWTEGRGCSVYSARPVQCRTYPFWPGVLDAPEDWEREGRSCPGIGRGEKRSRADIEEALWAYRANSIILLGLDATPETLDEDTVLGS